MQQTVSIPLLTILLQIPSFCLLVNLFWPQRKSHFYSWLKKMKHSREFVVTKLLKVAETNAKCHSIEETLFGLHVKHNESSKGLIYCLPDPPNQGKLWSYTYVRLPVKGLRISIKLVSVVPISKENRKVEGVVAQLFRKSWRKGRKTSWVTHSWNSQTTI